MSERPPAEALLPVMLDQGMLAAGRVKLSEWAQHHLLGELRCPKRHRLAACIRTVHGVWVLSRSNVMGRGWRPDWLDEVEDPAAMLAWCSPCGSQQWTLDLSDPTTPRLLR
jgi:hypothetical protein